MTLASPGATPGHHHALPCSGDGGFVGRASCGEGTSPIGVNVWYGDPRGYRPIQQTKAVLGHYWPVCGQSSTSSENGLDPCRGALSESPTGSHQKFIVPGRGGGNEEGPAEFCRLRGGGEPPPRPPQGIVHHGPPPGESPRKFTPRGGDEHLNPNRGQLSLIIRNRCSSALMHRNVRLLVHEIGSPPVTPKNLTKGVGNMRCRGPYYRPPHRHSIPSVVV